MRNAACYRAGRIIAEFVRVTGVRSDRRLVYLYAVCIAVRRKRTLFSMTPNYIQMGENLLILGALWASIVERMGHENIHILRVCLKFYSTAPSCVVHRGGSTLGQVARAPQINLLSPDSKASWKNVGLYGVCIFFSFGERIKWTR